MAQDVSFGPAPEGTLAIAMVWERTHAKIILMDGLQPPAVAQTMAALREANGEEGLDAPRS